MGFTRMLRDYDCSFAEYVAGRKVIRPRRTDLVLSSTPGVRKTPTSTTVKPKPRKIVIVEDESVPKLVRFDEKELKKIEHNSVSSKRKRIESKEIFSEGGVKINKRPPQEHASECDDCNIEKFGVLLICDTCIRTVKHKSSDGKDDKKDKKGKEKNPSEKHKKDKKKEKKKDNRSFWDNAEPWTSGLEGQVDCNTGWNNDAAAIGWDNNANNAWGVDQNGANWSGNQISNNHNNWDANGNSNSNNNLWDSNQNNGNGWGEDGDVVGHNAPGWNNNSNFERNNNGLTGWNDNVSGHLQGQGQNQNNSWEFKQNQIQQNGWDGTNGGNWNENQNGINWGNNTGHQINGQHGENSCNNNQNTNQNADKMWNSNNKSAPWMNGHNWVPSTDFFPRSEAGGSERCIKIHDCEHTCNKERDAPPKTSKKGFWVFVHDDEESTKARKDDQGTKPCHSHHQRPGQTKLNYHQQPTQENYHEYSWVPNTPSLPCNQDRHCPQIPSVPRASKPKSYHWIPDTHFPPTPPPPNISSPDHPIASYWIASTQEHHQSPLAQGILCAACHDPPPAKKPLEDIPMSRYWGHEDPLVASPSPLPCTGRYRSTLPSPYLNQGHGPRRGHSKVVTHVDVRASPPARVANAHFDQNSGHLTVYHDD